MATLDRSLFDIEDRGYGRGVGHLLHPNGSLIAVSQEELSLPLNNVLAKQTYEEWMALMAWTTTPPAPPEPSEGGGLRAKDLKNRVVVLRPTTTGSQVVQDKQTKEDRNWEFVVCQCWVIDGSDEPEVYEPELRIGWWRVKAQLEGEMGNYVVGRVVQQDDNSIILAPLDERRMAAVEKVKPQIEAQAASVTKAEDKADGFDEEPF